MTPVGIEDQNLVYKDSDYYKRMREWFDKYSQHPLIVALNDDLKRNPGRYFTLKMNGYAFEFDKQGKLVQSKIYDRTGFRGDVSNTLKPFLPQLQAFADETHFFLSHFFQLDTFRGSLYRICSRQWSFAFLVASPLQNIRIWQTIPVF